MIRDPSDGTVRETRRRRESAVNKGSDEQNPDQKPVLGADASGLPTDRIDAKELAKLERSRDWLKEFFAKSARN